MQAEIAAERPGILAWTIECCGKYQAFRTSGQKLIAVLPSEVVGAKRTLNEGADPVADFATRMLVVDQTGFKTSVALIRRQYEAWCKYSKNKPMSARARRVA